jgi:hypothetical protein
LTVDGSNADQGLAGRVCVVWAGLYQYEHYLR